MSNDALERLKKRQRPSVPSRDASLNSGSVDASTSGVQNLKEATSGTDISTPRYPEKLRAATDASTSEVQNLKEATSGTDISTSRYPEKLRATTEPFLLETKQSTLRLEVGLSERLSEVCQANGISREVLIEALFLHYEGEPQAWSSILTEAKRRGEYRMQVANFKRAQSMMQRFS